MRRELQPLLDLTPSLLQPLNALYFEKYFHLYLLYCTRASFDCFVLIRLFFEEFSENNIFNASSISNNFHYVKNNGNDIGRVIRIYMARKY